MRWSDDCTFRHLLLKHWRLQRTVHLLLCQQSRLHLQQQICWTPKRPLWNVTHRQSLLQWCFHLTDQILSGFPLKSQHCGYSCVDLRNVTQKHWFTFSEICVDAVSCYTHEASLTSGPDVSSDANILHHLQFLSDHFFWHSKLLLFCFAVDVWKSLSDWCFNPWINSTNSVCSTVEKWCVPFTMYKVMRTKCVSVYRGRLSFCHN